MSKTDKTDPIWVRLNGHRGDVRIWHCHRCCASGGIRCDLPTWPVHKRDRKTNCGYRPIGELGERIDRGSNCAPSSRKPFRQAWFAADRTAQRWIAQSLTRDANSGGEVDEDVIDNRKAGRLRLYSAGWWN
ncbi:hypothetical protein PP568_06850 [Mycobacteroides abscessus]|uniref:Bacteriophage protein n=1 Tax=Mycobacteroides abscessus subsp. abscessus TaxID=1185650 RepID=A0AB38D2N9_9MYCO|nr:hypothetical protein [Mycobacteroides abscessus]MBE5419574.1 hypothetical protein [Mycobacteroides abscessus]MBE5455727.1 hypothetical protein [Mycobacteroides abscessus]MBN7463154.1 hypothetical protein [Mycobacteroides abscessus subsp. abscessus]MBN7555257.1 hypothetical protein [Mycobacteroides abscessus subsp. abscessus]MDM2404649.1 hypothetical protein [Mycobacteroides abscessus]